MGIVRPLLRKPRLEDEQIAQYGTDGWTVVRQALGPEEMALVDAWSREVLDWPEEPGRHWVYREPAVDDPARKVLSRIEHLAPVHEGFAALAQALAAPVSQLLGEPAVLFKEKINFKMPGGGGFKPHQDSQAGWEKYASYFVTVTLAIDPATIENGCLFIAPWRGGQALFREWAPMTEEEVARAEWTALPMAPGDLAIFGSYTPHRSEPNRTGHMRRLYLSTYNRAAEGDRHDAYYADKRKSYPPDIERERGKEYVFRV